MFTNSCIRWAASVRQAFTTPSSVWMSLDRAWSALIKVAVEDWWTASLIVATTVAMECSVSKNNLS